MPATVLCVDRDDHLCEVLVKALGRAGYRVLSACDGDKALEVVQEHAPDLVLLSLSLPDRPGLDVLEAVRGLEPPACDTPVVLLCDSAPLGDDEKRAAALGAADLLTKPVPLQKLLGAVGRHLGEAKADAERPAAKPGVEVSDLDGSLETLPFPALLHQLHGLRLSGVLHLTQGRKKKWIQLRDGRVVAVRSNLVSECLGRFLVRSGRIDQADAAESLRRMEGGKLQGEILVAMELLSEQEISEALHEQAEEKLFETFAWESGAYRFEVGAHLQRASGFGVERSPANLILHGVRARFPSERIRAYLDAHRERFLARAENPFYRFQEIDLASGEEALLEQLDGSRRLGDFLTGSEDFERTLFGLLATGILELGGGKPVGASSCPRPPRTKRSPASAPDDTEQRAALAAQAERFRKQSYFEILGVANGASEEEIRAAYERVAESAHPDRFRSSSEALRQLAEEAFSHVEQAFQTLLDPRRREQYRLDQRRAEREASEREQVREALEAEREFQEGEVALRQRAYQKALRCFARARDLYPKDGEYHAHYGWALFLCHPEKTGKVNEAIRHIRKGIKLASDREKPYLFLGRVFKATERVDVAQRMFERALQVQPNCVEALRELRLINIRREKSKGLIGRLFRR